MKSSSKTLSKVSKKKVPQSDKGVIKLLLEDHKLMRKQMKKIKSSKSTPAEVIKTFKEMEKVVQSHAKAEEYALVNLLKDHPKFEDMAMESYEEHCVHDYVLAGIKKLRKKDRKVQQMRIFCEILEHHLDEEEEDLFPKFKKYTELSTRKKLGHRFLTKRK